MILLLSLILLPACSGLAAYLIRSSKVRQFLCLMVATVHFILSLTAVFAAPSIAVGYWIGIDALSSLFLVLTSMLFLIATIYGRGYLKREPADPQTDPDSGILYTNSPESVYTGSIQLFLASMTLTILSSHLGLQWMAIEATTLASAPLIYFHRSKTSLEAAWKYLILCSVGIAIALMGIFFISLALPRGVSDLTIAGLLDNAGRLNHKWLEVAFILMLVGYGTKMGLAPMHNWLPDAHSESPSPVSALLSGALLNCALLGLLRVQQINAAAGMASFGQQLFMVFGLVSMGTAGIFLLGQRDYKRMLAYSSVEHMGIITLGFGIGGIGTFGALLHIINHSLAKAQLFMTAGNIHSLFHTKTASKIQGLFRLLPVTGLLWITGFLAITGSPPFGTFISEFTILRAVIAQQIWWSAWLYIAFLVLAFIGMAGVFLNMCFGKPTSDVTVKESKTTIYPLLWLTLLSILLGLCIPGFLSDIIKNAASLLQGTR